MQFFQDQTNMKDSENSSPPPLVNQDKPKQSRLEKFKFGVIGGSIDESDRSSQKAKISSVEVVETATSRQSQQNKASKSRTGFEFGGRVIPRLNKIPPAPKPSAKRPRFSAAEDVDKSGHGWISASSMIDVSKYEEYGGGDCSVSPEEEDLKQMRKAKYRSAAASRVLPMPKSNPPDAERQGSSRSNQLPTRSPVGISSYRPVVGGSRAVSTTSDTSVNVPAELLADERLKGVEPRMIELILSEVIYSGPKVTWDDIAGLEFAKKSIKEIIVWPMLRPDLFTGIRAPPKGLLLFGPPGTGKTLIAKCIACQSNSTFFNISATSLTSKWVGDGEKMVRALFSVARCKQPAVIFLDEVDSLLSQRNDTEHEATRRMKTEMLVQLDGVGTDSEEKILVIGATNRPKEIDEAARRRFVKRLYVGLPNEADRGTIMKRLLKGEKFSITDEEFQLFATQTSGYSGADISSLCKDAALGPIRNIDNIETIQTDQVRPINANDFMEALNRVKSSVGDEQIAEYLEFDKKFGSGSAPI